MRLIQLTTAAFVLALLAAPLHAREAASLRTATVPASGVVGMEEAYLSADFWIKRQAHADRVVLDAPAIAAQNDKLMRIDGSMHDLRSLPPTLGREQVAKWIKDLSRRPEQPLFDVDGKPVPSAAVDAIVANLALDAIPEQQPTRYGMVVRRAALRTFPTALRVFNEHDDTDIDRFQESALFPGTPAVIAHRSRDGDWLFVVSPRYAAWIEKRFVAEGTKDNVLGYADKAPYRIVTGARVATVFTPEQPQVSELQLDMGTRAPLASVPANASVNGQHPFTSHVLELPIRDGDGKLQFVPALLQKNTDTAGDYLPLTKANIIRQAFKFLGERYGWGHDYNGRDCSGFVSDVYGSMGVLMPRNTGDQAASPALHRIGLGAADHHKRMQAVAALQVGDLVYIPGHVLLVIGRIDGVPYVIHDINGGSHLGDDGQLHPMHLNAVSVTPLTPLMFDRAQSYIDRITSIVRIRP
jgi:hypothetical protein